MFVSESICLSWATAVPRNGLPVDLHIESGLCGGGLSDSWVHSCFSRE